MKFLLALLVAGLPLFGIAAAPASKPAVSARTAIPASETLEKELQGLTWPQFKFVVNAVPKLKAKVDGYGKAGWHYVHSRYQTYGWKKSIDKFSPQEKKQLADLIRQAKQQ